jgi:dipeptidyl aminopeptidase/acylaminoacyl peptidase
MTAEGSRERVFSERTPATILDPPRWRSADELITVVRQGNDGEGRRFQLINVRSGAVEDVRGGAFPANLLPAVPRWSYARATDEIVYLAPAATAGTLAFHARRVGDGAGRILATMNPTGGRVYSFLVSPDAQQIAYVLQREKGCTPCELGLLVVPTGERTVVASPNNLQTVDAWSPDGRFVLHGPARPRVLDVASRQSWPLIEPPDQTTWNEEGEGAWAPDGSFVVIVVDTTVREWRQFRGVTIKAVGR